jgi:hypothetical protein
MSFVLACVLAATVLTVFAAVRRMVNQGCRYRCTCVRDSVALRALASITRTGGPDPDR